MESTTSSAGKKLDIKLTPSMLKEYLFMTLGILLYVSAWKLFLLPYTIVGGAATGICAIIYFVTERIFGEGNGIPIYLSFFILNATLILIAIRKMGFKFAIRTIFGVVVMTLGFRFVPQAEMGQFLSVNDSLLACILGGVMAGAGLGVLYLNNGSSGGTDIIAFLVNQKRNITLGRVLLYCDVVIISTSYFIGKGITPVIYGLVNMAILSFTVDMVMNGVRQSVQFFIFSQKYDLIADRINQEIHRGVTVMDGVGWYSKKPVKVITVMARKNESVRIFKLVKEIDPNAFVSQSAAAGVYGQGFDVIKDK